VVAARRVVTVGSYAATNRPRPLAPPHSLSFVQGDGTSSRDTRVDEEFEASVALRAHAKSCRGGRAAALMTAPACRVTRARSEKYAEAVELLWACN
jgi:hypothetical protein